MHSEARMKISLLRVALMVSWLGIAGFGGGFAIVQQLRRMVVDKYRWVSEEVFLECFTAASALPGTPSTNLVTMIGVRLRGFVGGTLSATLFLLPSVLLMIGFGAVHSRFRSIQALAVFLSGMGVATIGIVAAVAADIGRSALKKPFDWVLTVSAAVALVSHSLTLLEVMILAAACGAAFMRPPSFASNNQDRPNDKYSIFPSTLAGISLAALATSPLLVLLIVFARIGIATFGGGFAMIPAIEHEIVTQHRWLSEVAFNDAIVLGQITPGPVAIAATFIGYHVAGFAGALMATVGMFAPPMLLSLVAARSLEAFRANALIQGALRGVAPVMVGILAAAAIALWKTSVRGVGEIVIAVVATLVLLLARRTLPLFVLLGGGTSMLIMTWLR